MELSTLDPQFSFAGFHFPKWVWNLPKGKLAKRLADSRTACTSGYYHAPTPNQGNGIGFYLSDSTAPGLRWQWADEVIRLGHKGWYSNEDCSEEIRGLVFRLPRSRGFLAGWSMGEGMASSLDYDIHHTIEEAARAADGMAESTAEEQREYEEQEREKMEAEEREELERFSEEVEA